MQTLGHIGQHVRLVLRMAQATGLDLVTAHAAGDVTAPDWADIVQACRRCDWTGKCERWLDTHGTAARAPENCRNRNRFDAIGLHHHLATRD